jgi:glyoxylase-like metal-dependent hydrolase (beta-lactamase superfamily II)
MKVIVIKQGVHGDKGIKGSIERVIEPICGAVTLIPGKKNIIVDTGNLGYESEIVKELKKNHIKPEQIDYVINTHRHFDHCSNNYLFKNAIRVTERSIWYPNRKVEVYKSINNLKIPGVQLIATPGHQPEHIAVVVKAEKTYVIAGDAIEPQRIRNNFYKNNPNRVQIIASTKKIFRIADVIIPGHGPMLDRNDIKELQKIVASWRR